MKVTEAPAQIAVALDTMLTDGVMADEIVITSALEVAVGTVEQGLLEVTTQVTVCPLLRLLVLKVALLLPTLLPSTFHWYDGELPAFKVVAVNVAVAPAQIVVAEVEIVTEGALEEPTVIVILFETVL